MLSVSRVWFYIEAAGSKEKVKDRGERKERGRGGGYLKNAACVATATRKTTRGSPHPPPCSQLLLSIHFTILCYFQLMRVLVFHKHFFCCDLLFVPLKTEMYQLVRLVSVANTTEELHFLKPIATLKYVGLQC